MSNIPYQIKPKHMSSEKEVTEAIAKLTMEIRDKYPEMSKYLNEMPVTNPDEEHPQVSVERLYEYYDSLKIIFDRYAAEHVPATPSESAKTDDENL